MIRNIARSKAVLAGVAGAAAMELVAWGLQAVGLPAFDFADEIGAVIGPGRSAVGDVIGLAAHAAVGIAWALFYAYFFWGRLPWPPPLQGLAFASLPAILAALFLYPQLMLMRRHAEVVTLGLSSFEVPSAALLSILVMHAAYGLVIGSIYTHPVGYRVGRKPSRPPPPRSMERTPDSARSRPHGFIFATGIECSYPTVEHGRWRRDELQSSGHYREWQYDFELCRRLGISHLRYGPPLHLVLTGPGQFDWSWIDDAMAELKQHGPEPIVDLCHFGVPDWLGSLRNPELPQALAEYAAAFAERYPWVRFYTPVNEMYVCARMSALQGVWNDQEQDDSAFVAMAMNLARASNAMTDAILQRRPDAILVNNESSDFTQPCCPDPDIVARAELENERRFLPLDLIYAHELSDRMRRHALENGATEEDLARFRQRTIPRRSVLGVDYYEWNERLIDSDGKVKALGELFGWYVIASQYHRRYGLPMMHTETNRMDAADAPRWLWRQWHNVQLLRKSGVPLVGFTWYSLTDQIDWSIALSKPLGLVFPVGLFDLNRDVRIVGLAYKELIEMFSSEPELRECQCIAELMA